MIGGEKKLENHTKNAHVDIRNDSVEQTEHYIKMVGMGEILGCILIGPAGMGKTHLVEHTLEEMGTPYIKYGGHITLAAIYEYLFENHDKLIFFDDCSQLINHREIMELLKQALSESHAARTLSYRSHGVKTGPGCPPREFVFEGRIIMAFNKMDNADANVKAIMSRAPLLELKYSYFEVITALKEIAKGPGGSLLEHEKVIVTREIEQYTDSTMEVSLRDQQQAFKVYSSCKTLYGDPPVADKWKPLVHKIFGKKRESWIKTLVRDVCGDGKIPRKELVKLIAIKMGMSPRSAQRKVAEWLETEEIYQSKLRDGDVSIKKFI